MNELLDLLWQRSVLLLDFDGSVCSVFSGLSGREAADTLVKEINLPVPEGIARTRDPFDVLHYAASLGRATGERIERRFAEIEVEAVQSAQATPYFGNFMRLVDQTHYETCVVTNNSSEAVSVYIAAHDELPDYLRHSIFGRTMINVPLLKPNPYLLTRAIEFTQETPDQCVFIGDSVSDIQAARAASVAVIALANSPEKMQLFAEYAPDAVVATMHTLSEAVSYML
ncbi:HAD family hydrolase [Nocardia sp. NPDC005978]|uniref:HAD family hydrolase n=1 Tax=Nocardia sp. NPDC005978 TaxID=3156725 RepID=UPI0033ACFC79